MIRRYLSATLALALAILAFGTPAVTASCFEEAPYYMGRGEPGSVLASALIFPGSLAIALASLGVSQPKAGGGVTHAWCMPLVTGAHILAYPRAEQQARRYATD